MSIFETDAAKASRLTACALRAWVAGALAASCLAGACAAQDEAPSPPCSDAAHAQFDFWLGDWQVFAAKSEELAGFDRITRILDGCALRQEWTQFNDEFKPDGGDARLRGESLFALRNDGTWRQTWVSNSGFTVTLAGGVEDTSGDIVLRSDAVPYPSSQGGYVDVFFRWHWRKLDDGEVRSWGFTKVTEAGDWEPSFDNTYRANR